MKAGNGAGAGLVMGNEAIVGRIGSRQRDRLGYSNRVCSFWRAASARAS